MEDIEVVATATNGEDLFRQLERVTTDIVILDVHMPLLDGLETTKILKSNYASLKVLVLSMNNQLSLIKELLGAGASGYMLKTVGKEELEKAVRQVAAGFSYFSESITTELMRQYMPKSDTKQSNGSATNEAYLGAHPPAPFVLTEREKEIVSLVAYGNSTTQIASTLFIAPNTVETHRRNIIQKLGVKNSAGLTRYALKYGLIN